MTNQIKLNEIGESTLTPFKIETKTKESFKGAVRFKYFYHNSAGLQYRTSIVVIPANNLDEFIIAYYPEALKLIKDLTKEEGSIKVASITYAVQIDGGKFTDKIVTNKGDVLRIISTNVDLMKRMLTKDKSIKIMYISGQFKEEEGKSRTSDVSQRAKINLVFASKSLPPGWRIKNFGNLVLCIKNDLAI